MELRRWLPALDQTDAQEVTKVILEADNATVVALVRSDDEIREVSLSFCFFCLVFSPVMSWVWCFLL
jgi:hypothetical protein